MPPLDPDGIRISKLKKTKKEKKKAGVDDIQEMVNQQRNVFSCELQNIHKENIPKEYQTA